MDFGFASLVTAALVAEDNAAARSSLARVEGTSMTSLVVPTRGCRFLNSGSENCLIRQGLQLSHYTDCALTVQHARFCGLRSELSIFIALLQVFL